MANFQSRHRFTTRRPVLRVVPGLPVGKHRFRLVMVGINGKKSKPIFLTINVVRPKKPPRPDGPALKTGVAAANKKAAKQRLAKVLDATGKKPVGKKKSSKSTGKKTAKKQVAKKRKKKSGAAKVTPNKKTRRKKKPAK